MIKSKKIILFLVIILLLLIVNNILFRFIPMKPVMIESGNMEPTYSKYDVLFYSDKDNYNVGDVVLVHVRLLREESFVSRIININDDGTFELKGDLNPTQLSIEKNVSQDRINGVIKYSMSPFVFYCINWVLNIFIAILLTEFFYKRYFEKGKK